MPNLRMPGENCSIFNCYSSRAAPGISFFRIPTKNDYKIKLEEQHCCSYYSCVDGDLKRQIKNRTLHTSRLFPLTKIFRYTSNWSKASWAFTHPLINYASLYKKGLRLFTSHSWYTSNNESANKNPPVIKVAFLSGIILVSDCGCKGQDNKITTMLYDRYFIYKTVKSSHSKKLQIM